jgi:iron complex transport system ATP-binding protein
MPPRTAALHLAAVPQEQPTEFDMQVVDLVRLGRLPHKGLFEGDREADRQVIHDSLARVGMSERGHRLLSELSGGERQRAVIARALAQQPSVLLLDEPTNHLDIRHQHDLLTLLRRLGITTLIAVHDLNLAAQYCDHVVVLRDGRVLAAGPVDEALTPDVIRQAFDVHAVQVRHPVTGSPQLLFHHNPEEKPA